jgi:hypothetical protein
MGNRRETLMTYVMFGSLDPSPSVLVFKIMSSRRGSRGVPGTGRCTLRLFGSWTSATESIIYTIGTSDKFSKIFWAGPARPSRTQSGTNPSDKSYMYLRPCESRGKRAPSFCRKSFKMIVKVLKLEH